MMVLLPAILLNYLGISYTLTGGEAWEKVHPSTYVCILALIAAAFSRADPIRFFVDIGQREPRVMLFFLGLVVIAVTTFMTEGMAELGFLLDTFFMPAIIMMVLCVTPLPMQRLIFKIVVGLVIVNAVIGIIEVLLHEQFIPPTNADGSPFIDLQFRPWALLDHPLNNALITSTTLIVVYTAIPTFIKRFAFLLLLLTGLFAFGGRTAFLGSIAALLLLLALSFGSGLRHRRFTYAQSIFTLVLILAVPLALAVLLATTNIGERIIENLAWDGSAETRLQVYKLLNILSGDDLWFGVGGRRLAEMSSAIGGQGIIIENFWLVLLARLGLLQFALFVVIFLLFLSRLWRGASGNVRLAIVLFLVVASSNNSLSVKGTALSLVTAMVFCSRAMRLERGRAEAGRMTPRAMRYAATQPRLRPLPGQIAKQMRSAGVDR